MPNPSKAPRKRQSLKQAGTHFRLTYLPVNQRWVVTWGEQIIPISQRDSGPDVRSFATKKEATAALKRVGLKPNASGVIVNA